MDKAEMKRLLKQHLRGMRLMNERVAQERRESTPKARFRGAAMFFQVQPIDPDGEKKKRQSGNAGSASDGTGRGGSLPPPVLRKVLRAISAWLDGTNLKAAIVGGIAVSLYGGQNWLRI
jgi:hypothetical protein